MGQGVGNDTRKEMRMSANAANDIDEYIAGFPEDVQVLLEQIRATIRDAAPDATEAISYAMPTFKLNGNLVHFAAFKNHIGLYPTPSALDKFKEELSTYEGSKGAVRFPLDKPMPLALITEIVKFRVNENMEKAEAKANKNAK
jgi:uncharacterized protein YdhG (YjbR/CyaY superfamily)